jgi:hypothetical protein
VEEKAGQVMSTPEYDSNFLAQVRGASKRAAEAPVLAADEIDLTRPIRTKQANLCDAVMMRVVELEDEAKRLAEIAKKLRAAVVANT